MQASCVLKENCGGKNVSNHKGSLRLISFLFTSFSLYSVYEQSSMCMCVYIGAFHNLSLLLMNYQ